MNDSIKIIQPSASLFKDMNDSIKIIQPHPSFSDMLEFEANNDVDGFNGNLVRPSKKLKTYDNGAQNSIDDRCKLPDKTTALHSAASDLLISGADADLVDADGRRPADVLLDPPNLPNLKISIAKLLKNGGFCVEQEDEIDLTSFKSIEKKDQLNLFS
ncbi:hypothetical protein LXL04_017121 [Taraxacum kok-saghyz]